MTDAWILQRIDRAMARAYRTPRRWQVDALPACLHALRIGSPSVVYAATGAGKSDSIGMLLASFADDPRLDLVVVPTQKLVVQTAADLRRWTLDVGEWYQHRRTYAQVTVTCRPSLPLLADTLRAEGHQVRVVVVDECHGLGQESECIAAINQLHADHPKLRRIGYSATPTREDGIGMAGLWPGGFAYSYPMSAAIADGVILPPSIIEPTEADASDGCPTDPDGATLWMIRRYAKGPTVVDAASIADAERFAAFLADHGLRTEAIHSKCKGGVAEPLERLRTGAIEVLVHVRMLSEGVDLPWLGTIVIQEKTSSIARFVQTVGRVLRVAHGKHDAIVIDMRHQWHAFGGTPHFSIAGMESAMTGDGRELSLVSTPSALRKQFVKDPIAFVSLLDAWAATLWTRCVEAGIVTPRRFYDPDHPASPKTRALLAKWADDHRKSPARYIDEDQRERWHIACATSDLLCKATAERLCGIGIALLRAGGEHFRSTHHGWNGAKAVTRA